MDVHLVDGTYELFRHFYSPRGGHENGAGEEVGAVRGVCRTVCSTLVDGATHVGVATDHVVESFRNALYAPYKDGSDIDPVLSKQFPLLEDALEALGVTVWPMVDLEADDALGSAAAVGLADSRVERCIIYTPDKDLAQCVVGDAVVQYDRRSQQLRNESDIIEKYGVSPESIPDWLALVGDSADGIEGLKGWGAKSAARVLSRYRRLEDIPKEPGQWDITVRSSMALADTLQSRFDDALLFRHLATLVCDADVGTVDSWEWQGPHRLFDEWCERLDIPDVHKKLTARNAQRS